VLKQQVNYELAMSNMNGFLMAMSPHCRTKSGFYGFLGARLNAPSGIKLIALVFLLYDSEVVFIWAK